LELAFSRCFAGRGPLTAKPRAKRVDSASMRDRNHRHAAKQHAGPRRKIKSGLKIHIRPYVPTPPKSQSRILGSILGFTFKNIGAL
jgi:hypothetical protein